MTQASFRFRLFARLSRREAELTETAALRESLEALREALFNNADRARSTAKALLSGGRVVQCVAALALALAGETAQAQKLVDELTHRFPEDTFVQFEWVPTIRAQIALEKHDFSGSIESLKRAAVYEMGALMRFYPAYIRGQAYLTAHQGKESAAEFQKVLDYWGVVVNEPIGALAHLQLGRAYAMQGDTANAKVAYQDFLTLWKDADPDIPILKQAKAEYSKLK